MPLSNAFAAPYILKRGKEEQPVPLLTMDQIGTLIATLEKRRNDRLRKHIAEKKLDGTAAAQFLEIGEREEMEIFHLRAHARSIKGANEMLKMVLSEPDLAALTLEERIEAAMGAIGWKPEPPKDDTANPPSAGAPSIGSRTAG